MPESYTTQVTEYRLSILPEDHIDADLFAVYVRWRGEDRWSVESRVWCLGADGAWDESRTGRYLEGTERTAWLASHRFDHDTAMRLAAEMLPTIECNGKTAADILARKAEG